MMTVEVRLFAGLRQYCPQLESGEPVSFEVEDGTTAAEFIRDKLGIPDDVVKAVFINGEIRRADRVLSDRDRIGIFPPIAGGQELRGGKE